MANYCAPGKYDPKAKTCFTIEQLIEIAKAFNKYVTKNNLGSVNNVYFDTSLINIKPDKSYLVKEIMNRFRKICDNDKCLTKQDFMNEITTEMREDIMTGTFRPEGPTNPKEWLSTSDIDGIMIQYEKVYPDFKFMGAVPLDCNDHSFCSLFKLDFDQLIKEGKNQLGIVFNLDKVGEPGSHWVAMYINLKGPPEGEICFCDSTGKPPVENINTVIKEFKKWYQTKYGMAPEYCFNKNKYQKDTSECGVYSCNFLIRRLAGQSFNEIVNNPLNFKEINSCRNVYFSNNPSKHNEIDRCDPRK
jgi:hypothetical protein